jgi:hypothetical protein
MEMGIKILLLKGWLKCKKRKSKIYSVERIIDIS